MDRPIVVIKVGGSLLDWPELPSRLEADLEARRASHLVLVAGGGRFADVLRDLDQCHCLGEEISHSLALRTLELTAHFLQSIMPRGRVIERTDELEATWLSDLLPILSPRLFLEADDQSRDPLPHAWSTTTDSIAARLAVRLGASELVLMKSASIPAGLDRERASTLGLVDPEFPRTARAVPTVTFLNLREPRSGSSGEKIVDGPDPIPL